MADLGTASQPRSRPVNSISLTLTNYENKLSERSKQVRGQLPNSCVHQWTELLGKSEVHCQIAQPTYGLSYSASPR